MTKTTGNTENDERGLLPYPVIIAATKGDPDAMKIGRNYSEFLLRNQWRYLRTCTNRRGMLEGRGIFSSRKQFSRRNPDGFQGKIGRQGGKRPAQTVCCAYWYRFLLFMTYISDNVNIPRLLLEQAVAYVSEWTEFDISDIGVKYLRTIPIKEISPPKENEKDKEIQKQAIMEAEQDMPIETLDIYDYDETKIDELNNQLIRALLQLKIIARNFSAFISILPAATKKDYALAMYQLPNKIFNQWAESVDNSIEQLIEEIIEWQESSDFEGKKFFREDISRFFQDISFNLLLNLFYSVSSYGANDNTIDYLAQQDYVVTSPNYRIERLLFFEKVDDYHAVIKEAEDLYSKQVDGMARNMVLSILRHMIVHSDRMSDGERRRISSKYFASQNRTKILIDRQRAQKEKGV